MKTLKDMDTSEIDCESCALEYGVHDNEYNYDGEDNQAVSKTELKEEAIKWIKEMNSCDIPLIISNGIPSTAEGSESYMVKNTNKSALILWIKHFFNITDEELK